MDDKETVEFYRRATKRLMDAIEADTAAFGPELRGDPMLVLRSYLALLNMLGEFQRDTNLAPVSTMQIVRLALRALTQNVILTGNDLPQEPNNEVFESLQFLISFDSDGGPPTENCH